MATSMHPGCLSALRAGNTNRLRALLRDDPTRFYGETIKGNSILHIAASLGNDWPITEACNFPEMDLLLHHQNLKGDTVLHCAARAGHDHILSLLINHEAGTQMIGVLNQRGESALHEATRGGHTQVVRQLLAVGENMASVVNGDGESPLYLAAVRGSVETVKVLLECAMVDYRGPRGQTALHAAVCRSYDITKMILEKMPGLNLQTDASGSTPIHYAVSLGDANMAHLLLQENPTVAHLLDNEGLSAIHIAASKDYTRVIEKILHHCPDATELIDADGNNFFHFAAKKGARTVVKLVLDDPLLKQIINETDHEGNTPLHLAVMHHNFEIVYLLLLYNNVDKNVINCKGLTPLDVALSIDASQFGSMRTKMIKILRLAGIKFDPRQMEIVISEDQDCSKEELDRHRAMANNLSIMATLIATVTFAAAFTLPGGYNNDGSYQKLGSAILAKDTYFQVFLISDTIAMISSISVVLLLIYSSLERHQRFSLIVTALWLLMFAVAGMLLAFYMGIIAVLVPQNGWLVTAIGLINGVALSILFLAYVVRLFSAVSMVGFDKQVDKDIQANLSIINRASTHTIMKG